MMKQHSVTVLSRKKEEKVKSNDIPSNTAIESEIRERAYDLYEKHGRLDGRDLEDWLEAERDVRRAPAAVA